MTTTSMNLEENLAGALCYVLGWLTGIIFLVLEKENRFVRFHAMQSLVTFLALFVISITVGMIPLIGWIISILLTPVGVILWLILMYKAYQGEMYKLPVIGDFVEKQLETK
jgi:uncharacterized membrane protein